MSDHRELIEEVKRAHYRVESGCECQDGDHPCCWVCYADWPCQSARLADALAGYAEHRDHCDCYRQSRASNESWIRAYQEVLARAEAAERRVAELEDLLKISAAMYEHDVPALEQRAEKAEAELAYTTSWAHSAGGSLAHMDGVAAELRAQVAALEQQAARAEKHADGLIGQIDEMRKLSAPVTQRLADERKKTAALSGDLEAARAALESGQMALLTYGIHDPACAIHEEICAPSDPCTCGFSAALAALAPQPAAEAEA